ncbi:hypothetical protein [Streptomyces marincola]|uniref:hypothetical protein n=1 Tax=Streptomyces marincola TaxID=2878388 RepID=UPI001CF2C963|nr:hypothetical protein [Streptomyces marincola]UCM91638.1 hypothetical protein LC193_28835 [Streptomyces marincola]
MAVLCGCGGEGEPPTDGVPAVPTSPKPREIPMPPGPPETRDGYDACGGDPFDAGAVVAYSPDGPAWSGPGPHPAVLFRPGSLPEVEVPQLPQEWSGSAPYDFTQLVVCEYSDDEFEGEKVGDCSYLGGAPYGDRDPEVFSERYIYRVFEAKTGEQVAEFSLDGTTSPDESCPETSYAPPSTYWQRVESDALEEELRPLVEGSAP